jgi:hypothetical protein
MVTLQITCPHCDGETVSAYTLLSDQELPAALESGVEVRVMHIVNYPDSTSEDHIWSLPGIERNNLQKWLEDR